MGENEAATVPITKYREIMSDLVEQYRGRIVDSPGYNVLADFASVVDVTQCAVSVQKEIQSRNSELPEARRMQFRIGINIGDVIEEGEGIYGDGVNIASRLESLTDPGGIPQIWIYSHFLIMNYERIFFHDKLSLCDNKNINK